MIEPQEFITHAECLALLERELTKLLPSMNLHSGDLLPNATSAIETLNAELAQLRFDHANHFADVRRIEEWLPTGKLAQSAFTDGPERQIAYRLEHFKQCISAQAATCAKQEARLNALEPAYNKLVALLEEHSQTLPPRIVQIIYNETCCQPTPEQAKGEACACVAGHLVNEIEDWAAGRVAEQAKRIEELEREAEDFYILFGQGWQRSVETVTSGGAKLNEASFLNQRVRDLVVESDQLRSDLADHMLTIKSMGECR